MLLWDKHYVQYLLSSEQQSDKTMENLWDKIVFSIFFFLFKNVWIKRKPKHKHACHHS